MVEQPEVPMTDVVTRSNVDAGPEVDPALLEEARRSTGATSSNEVINDALELVVGKARERRRHAYDEVQRMVAEEGLDFAAIDEVDR
jgi:hypothetical protein